MKSKYILVEWVEEKKFSVVRRENIVDEKEKSANDEDLIGREIHVFWKSKRAYKAQIIQCGEKVDLTYELSVLLESNEAIINAESEELNANTSNPNHNQELREEIQNVLNGSEHHEPSRLENALGRVHHLEMELVAEKEKTKMFKNKYREMKKKYNSVVNKEGDFVEIGAGSGIVLPKDQLNTILAVSDNATKLARNLMAALYTRDELINCSLFGQRCNANLLPARPSIEPIRRDAIIEFTLEKFGGQTRAISKINMRNPLLHLLHASLGDYLRYISKKVNKVATEDRQAF